MRRSRSDKALGKSAADVAHGPNAGEAATGAGVRMILRVGVAVLAMMPGVLGAQGPGQSAMNPGSNPAPGANGSQELGTAVQAQQQLNAPGPALSPSNGSQANTNQNYNGSLIEGKATGGVLPLGLDEAIQRGLRTNLGLILEGSNQRQAGGQRLQQLQALLPTASVTASYTVEQVDLAAYGLKIPGIPGVVGPFQVEDFRGYLSQSVVNLQALETYIAGKHNFAAAKLTAEDARDLVVLTVGNAYLMCIADGARIRAVQAELDSSRLSLQQANDAHDAGTSPKLDVLRAQVDTQNEQQTLIQATNQLAKDKISLARTIGLPLDQKFELTDTTPFAALDTPDPEAAFQQALNQRKDLAAAVEKRKAAEAEKKAALAEILPTASVSGNFGDLGETFTHSHGTYDAEGAISAPLFQVAKTRGDKEVAAAQLDQAKAKLSDQVQQVNADVRDAILDIQTAAKLVQATQSNVELSREALLEAQERFKAGVADSLPVSQALATDRQAEDQFISALYQHNVAKLSLARALGVASTSYKEYLVPKNGAPQTMPNGGMAAGSKTSVEFGSAQAAGPATGHVADQGGK